MYWVYNWKSQALASTCMCQGSLAVEFALLSPDDQQTEWLAASYGPFNMDTIYFAFIRQESSRGLAPVGSLWFLKK